MSKALYSNGPCGWLRIIGLEILLMGYLFLPVESLKTCVGCTVRYFRKDYALAKPDKNLKLKIPGKAHILQSL